MADQDFVPYVPAEKIMPEFTAKMIVVGVILTIVMAAANAYLGLFAGMTVSATIPAVVMALAVLRPLKGTILEINLSKAMAVTGEALAAGVIFTFPALLVLYHLTDGTSGWETLMTHWPEMIVGSLIGGVLGILFGIGGFAGMYCGARLQKFMPEKFIKVLLGGIISFLALRYILQFFG